MRIILGAMLIVGVSMGCGGGGGGGTGGSGGDGGSGGTGGSGGSTGGGSGGSGGGTAGGSGGGTGGGGMRTGTPVNITATTATTSIPVNSTNCTSTTYGDKADLVAVNTPVFLGNTDITQLTLRFDMGIYFGEPTRAATISWNGKGSLYDVKWLAEVQDKTGKQYTNASGKRVFASYLIGTVKGPGQGFGSDTTGSPSWSQTFVTYDGNSTTSFGVTEADAKNIYKGCFKLANVRILGIDGKPALVP